MKRAPTRRMLATIALTAALGGLVTACGVKGPLYLPEEQETEEEKSDDEEKTSLWSPAPQRTTRG
ncbi:MAG: hypothetical protein GTO67_07080 [Gammaproteobacteria bacterium]|nr:hypothetical protein [Gammaproteobacteria bacterium]NIM72026.1 hypothetical protein [Gammaproteobacteria bacterium]NIN38434.1 hypothetical protein [Gammaproteobacteria bacterium]NIO23753.1 hypothetical protein [Gammaproteobacteria bacterium]NIO64395.1 hypothetical protein [Gammaproteobacteria bacterium]